MPASMVPNADYTDGPFYSYFNVVPSGDHYSTIDEYSGQDDTDYVWGETEDTWDEYYFSDPGVPEGVTVSEVRVYARGKFNAARSNIISVSLVLNDDSVYTQGYLNFPNGSFDEQSVAWTENPGTSGAWTYDQVNGVGPYGIQRIGFYVGDLNLAKVYISRIHVIITYSTSASHTASGGGIGGAVASWNKIFNMLATGGGIAGGTSPLTNIVSYDADGGGIAGYAADFLQLSSRVMSGGGLAGGSIDVSKVFNFITTGGGIVGGVPAINLLADFQMVGGGISGGQAVKNIGLDFLPSGGGVGGGLVTFSRAVNFTPTLGGIAGGTSEQGKIQITIMVGGAIAGSVAHVIYRPMWLPGIQFRFSLDFPTIITDQDRDQLLHFLYGSLKSAPDLNDPDSSEFKMFLHEIATHRSELLREISKGQANSFLQSAQLSKKLPLQSGTSFKYDLFVTDNDKNESEE